MFKLRRICQNLLLKPHRKVGSFKMLLKYFTFVHFSIGFFPIKGGGALIRAWALFGNNMIFIDKNRIEIRCNVTGKKGTPHLDS